MNDSVLSSDDSLISDFSQFEEQYGKLSLKDLNNYISSSSSNSTPNKVKLNRNQHLRRNKSSPIIKKKKNRSKIRSVSSNSPPSVYFLKSKKRGSRRKIRKINRPAILYVNKRSNETKRLEKELRRIKSSMVALEARNRLKTKKKVRSFRSNKKKKKGRKKMIKSKLSRKNRETIKINQEKIDRELSLVDTKIHDIENQIISLRTLSKNNHQNLRGIMFKQEKTEKKIGSELKSLDKRIIKTNKDKIKLKKKIEEIEITLVKRVEAIESEKNALEETVKRHAIELDNVSNRINKYVLNKGDLNDSIVSTPEKASNNIRNKYNQIKREYMAVVGDKKNFDFSQDYSERQTQALL